MKHLFLFLAISALAGSAFADDNSAHYTLNFDANLRASPFDQEALRKAEIVEGDVLEVIYNPTRVFSTVQQGAGDLAFDAGKAPPELTSLFIVSGSPDVRLVHKAAGLNQCNRGAPITTDPDATSCDQLTDKTFGFVTNKANLGIYECKLGDGVTVKDIAPEAWLFSSAKRFPAGPAFTVSGIKSANLTVQINSPLLGLPYQCTVGNQAAAISHGAPAWIFTAPTPAFPFKVSCSIMAGGSPTDGVISTTSLDVLNNTKDKMPATAAPAKDDVQCLRFSAPNSVKLLADLDPAVRVGTFLGAGPDVPVELSKRDDGTYGALIPLKAGANTYRMEVSRGGKAQQAGAATTMSVQAKDTHSLVRVQADLISSDRLRKLDFAFAVAPVTKDFFRGGPWTAKCNVFCTVTPIVTLRLASSNTNGNSVLSLGGGIAVFINQAFQLNGGLLVGTADLQTAWRADRSWFIGVALDPFIISETIQPQAPQTQQTPSH